MTDAKEKRPSTLMSLQSDTSVIGRRARIDGALVSAGSLAIHGQMKGDVAVEGEVLVSVDAVVEADIRAGSIRLGGQIRGDLSAPGDIALPPHSQVEGDVRARNVMVHGAVKGNVVAEGRVELGQEAWVEGDITCVSLVVAEGALFRGRSIMDVRR
jgi:cytoskeletal protein CcmA (bactofilin family)